MANKISIIVPVHNASKTLHICIQSIIFQDYDNMECILVENGSSDDSADLCKAYSVKYPFIKSVISVDQGVSNARNLGLSLATGKIIGFVDADDVLEPRALRCVADEFEKNSNTVAVIGAFFVGHKLETRIDKAYKGLNSQVISPVDAVALTIGNDSVMGSVWNKYYRADVLRDVLFDTGLSYCEDMHFNVKVLSSMPEEYRISLIDTPLYCYMMNELSVTHQLRNLFETNGELKYIVALNKILNECNLSKRCQSIVKKSIACIAIDYYGIGNKIQRKKLRKEISGNYIHLLRNIALFDFWKNIKTVIKSFLCFLGIGWRRRSSADS